MERADVTLLPLEDDDREQFILDNQEEFRYGALEEFGTRDSHFEEEGEIISRSTIEQSIDDVGARTYRIVKDGEYVGGAVLKIDESTQHNELVLLFVCPHSHSRGVGYGAWLEIEKMYPETKVWETCTPYFDKRNLHFYINKCKFHAVEFTNEHFPGEHPDEDGDGPFEMFRFEKVMK